jgi:hypothetical protein
VGPTISALTGGGFVAVWNDVGSHLSFGIKAQIFADNGSRVGNEFFVDTYPHQSGGPTTTALANGGFVVSWVEGHYPDDDIKAQIFDAHGDKMGAEFLVNSNVASIQLHPSITALTNGDFVVSWQDGEVGWDDNGNEVNLGSQTLGDSTGDSIKAQMFAPDGSKIGGEFLVNTSTLGNQDRPAIAGLSGGGFLVSWQDDPAPQGTVGPSIKAQMFALYDALAITSDRGGASAAVGVAEGTTLVTTVTAVDPTAAGAIQFAISGGADASLFRIDALTGVLAFNAAPDFEGPADAGKNNVYDVVVSVSNGHQTDSQAIAVSVTNVVPTAQDDGVFFTIPQTPVKIAAATLLANDSNPDHDSLSLASVQAATNGTVSFDGTTVTFTPNKGYAGAVSFTYTLTDGRGDSDTAAVAVNVATSTINGVPTVPNAQGVTVAHTAGAHVSSGENGGKLSSTSGNPTFQGGAGQDGFIIQAGALAQSSGLTNGVAADAVIYGFANAGHWTASNNDFVALTGFGAGSKMTFAHYGHVNGADDHTLQFYTVHDTATIHDYTLFVRSLDGQLLAAGDFNFL